MAQAKNQSADAQVSLQVQSATVLENGELARIELSARNMSPTDVWMNLEPALQSGLVFVEFRGVRRSGGRSLEVDAGPPPRDGYVVIAPGEERRFATTVDIVGLEVRPGPVLMDVCYRNLLRNPPPAPPGAVPVPGPIGVSSVVNVVRR